MPRASGANRRRRVLVGTLRALAVERDGAGQSGAMNQSGPEPAARATPTVDPVRVRQPAANSIRAVATPLNLALANALLLLTGGVGVDGWPLRLDRVIYRALPAPTGTGLSDVAGDLAQLVSTMATPPAAVAFTVAVAAAVSARARTAGALRRVVPSVVAVSAAVLLGKALLHRAGPPGSRPQGDLGYFPSGHTATALVCAGTLTALLAESHPQWRARLTWASAGWTALVAASMVFHRYHWLTDVVSAGLLGCLILRIDRAVRNGR